MRAVRDALQYAVGHLGKGGQGEVCVLHLGPHTLALKVSTLDSPTGPLTQLWLEEVQVLRAARRVGGAAADAVVRLHADGVAGGQDYLLLEKGEESLAGHAQRLHAAAGRVIANLVALFGASVEAIDAHKVYPNMPTPHHPRGLAMNCNLVPREAMPPYARPLGPGCIALSATTPTPISKRLSPSPYTLENEAPPPNKEMGSQAAQPQKTRHVGCHHCMEVPHQERNHSTKPGLPQWVQSIPRALLIAQRHPPAKGSAAKGFPNSLLASHQQVLASCACGCPARTVRRPRGSPPCHLVIFFLYRSWRRMSAATRRLVNLCPGSTSSSWATTPATRSLAPCRCSTAATYAVPLRARHTQKAAPRVAHPLSGHARCPCSPRHPSAALPQAWP